MRSPRFFAALAVLFWGVSFVATKAALTEVRPVTLIFLRFAIGAVVLLIIVRELPPRAYWPQLALMGFIGIFIHQMLQSYALTMTTATNTGWLIGLCPIWTAVLAAIFLRERFGFWKVVGLVGGFMGALLVVTRGELQFAGRPSTTGDLMILISTINWAVYTVVGQRTIKALGPRRATSGAMLFGASMLTPFFVVQRGWRDVPHLSTIGWTSVLFLALCCSALGYLFWYGALEQIEAARVASLLYAEPLVTFAAAALLLGERVSGIVIAGCILVLASVLVAQYAPAVRTQPMEEA